MCVSEGFGSSFVLGVASLCSISCLCAQWVVTGPAGGDVDLKVGGMLALL